jgi:hypothetical protein
MTAKAKSAAKPHLVPRHTILTRRTTTTGPRNRPLRAPPICRSSRKPEPSVTMLRIGGGS